MVDLIFYVIENLYQHYHYVCLLGNGKFVLSDRKLDHCRNKKTYTMVNLFDTCSALTTLHHYACSTKEYVFEFVHKF